MSSSKTMSLTFILLLIQTLLSISHANVPASATFKYVNKGEFGSNVAEYNANYRLVPFDTYPFQLCFYNTTPNTYYLGLRFDTVSSLMRWVWDFNRGNPVRDNATFRLGTNGNLVLADFDGRVAWQSGTANKGVVGFKLLSNGNMVLYDNKGKFVWQSFDHPTDTLVVGQSLRAGSKLVSRRSPEKNTNGDYSLVLENTRYAMYYQPKSSPKPQLYYESSSRFLFLDGSLEFLRLNVTKENEIKLDYKVANSTKEGGIFLGYPLKYNASVTYLRLGIDGTLKTFTYDQEFIIPWDVSFDLFQSNDIGICQLPEKCGKFGLCDKDQCVACPSPNGLLGWSEKCKPPKLSSSSCDVKKVKYYKIVGVDHFVSKYTKGDGPMKEGDCSKKCTLDCKCAGYFYQTDDSLCWIVSDLKTLIKVGYKNHLGYIKI